MSWLFASSGQSIGASVSASVSWANIKHQETCDKILESQLFQNMLWILKHCSLDFPGGPVVRNLPAHAGGKGSIPGLGRSQMPRSKLSPHTRTSPSRPRACPLQQEKPPQEKPMYRNLRKCAATKTSTAEKHSPLQPFLPHLCTLLIDTSLAPWSTDSC